MTLDPNDASGFAADAMELANPPTDAVSKTFNLAMVLPGISIHLAAHHGIQLECHIPQFLIRFGLWFGAVIRHEIGWRDVSPIHAGDGRTDQCGPTVISI